jgi:hypothetical protein
MGSDSNLTPISEIHQKTWKYSFMTNVFIMVCEENVRICVELPNCATKGKFLSFKKNINKIN